MGETASTDEAAANGDLAHLLAEAAAGRPGVQERLAQQLRPRLASLLSRRLASGETASAADAGALVLQHWQQLAGAGEPAAGSAARVDAGAKAKPTKKAAGGKSRKAARSAKAGKEAELTAAASPAAPEAEAAAGPLFSMYVEQASQVMQGLVRDLAARADPGGAASRTLDALATLDGLDPSLARVVRLRWLAGLDEARIARLLGESEAEVQRRWLKACAFVAAATKNPSTASP